MVKVTICGATSEIGEALSVEMKRSSTIEQLALYDNYGAHDLVDDMRDIASCSKVTGYDGNEEIEEALKNADIVLIVSCISHYQSDFSKEETFNRNAQVIRNMSTCIALYTPDALVGIISDDVSSTVVVACQVFKKYKVFNPCKIFGITTLDAISSYKKLTTYGIKQIPDKSNVSVVCGHGVTAVPLFSKVKGIEDLTKEQIKEFIDYVRNPFEKCTDAIDLRELKLAMVYNITHFGLKLYDAVVNDVSHTTFAYVCLEADAQGGKDIERIVGEIDYFTAPVKFGKQGINLILPIKDYSSFEYALLNTTIPKLKEKIAVGLAFN